MNKISKFKNRRRLGQGQLAQSLAFQAAVDNLLNWPGAKLLQNVVWNSEFGLLVTWRTCLQSILQLKAHLLRAYQAPDTVIVLLACLTFPLWRLQGNYQHDLTLKDKETVAERLVACQGRTQQQAAGCGPPLTASLPRGHPGAVCDTRTKSGPAGRPSWSALIGQAKTDEKS